MKKMDKYTILKALTDKKLKIMLMLGVLLLVNLVMVFGSPAEDAGLVKLKLACLICRIMTLFLFVAGAIAALVIVIAGIRWVGSGEDPGARTAAKSSVVSALVGLIIIVLAVYLVTWLVSSFGVMSYVDLTDWLMNGCDTICNAESIDDI
ncbi:MAG: TrbC/VirB2 family protein [Candidatus Altiarchaeota archaeon]|nr:TrbC/VirB2 family protein [Candidatus Altiarchaeota archaeon]